MPANNNGRRFKVDSITDLLSQEDRLQFDEYCWQRPTYTAVKRRIDDLRSEYLERGIEIPYVSQAAVDAWYKAVYPPAEAAAMINQITREFDGLEPDGLVRYAAGIIVKFLEPLRETLQDPDFLQSCKAETLIHNAMVGLKEIRTIGTTLKQREALATNRALERSGAYRLAEIARQVAKDQKFETEIVEALTAALLQHDGELQ